MVHLDITVQMLNQEVLVVAEMPITDRVQPVHQVKEILEVQVLHTQQDTLVLVLLVLMEIVVMFLALVVVDYHHQYQARQHHMLEAVAD